MTYSKDDLLPLSALQHYLFCKRQCALIHVERQWFENLYTAEGRIMHERVDKGGERGLGAVRIEYALDLVCHRYGLVGRADVVEFHLTDDEMKKWIPYPVEYKRGKPKKNNIDKAQLCAQALCLEEMYQVAVHEGALFYGKTRRRQNVTFCSELREVTIKTAQDLHQMMQDRLTPEPEYAKKCKNCSFLDFCMPKVCKMKSAKSYLKKMTG